MNKIKESAEKIAKKCKGSAKKTKTALVGLFDKAGIKESTTVEVEIPEEFAKVIEKFNRGADDSEYTKEELEMMKPKNIMKIFKKKESTKKKTKLKMGKVRSTIVGSSDDLSGGNDEMKESISLLEPMEEDAVVAAGIIGAALVNVVVIAIGILIIYVCTKFFVDNENSILNGGTSAKSIVLSVLITFISPLSLVLGALLTICGKKDNSSKNESVLDMLTESSDEDDCDDEECEEEIDIDEDDDSESKKKSKKKDDDEDKDDEDEDDDKKSKSKKKKKDDEEDEEMDESVLDMLFAESESLQGTDTTTDTDDPKLLNAYRMVFNDLRSRVAD